MKEYFLSEYEEKDDFLENAVNICQSILSDIKKEKNVTASYTTIVILIISNNKAQWCHVGDSRLYYIREGHISERTLDHSVPQMLFNAGMISEDEIRGHPDRSKLLRALGREDKEIKADISDICELKTGDGFLLCTDGFWDYVTEDDIEEAFSTFSAADDRITALETNVRDKGLKEKTDNYSAICVCVE